MPSKSVGAVIFHSPATGSEAVRWVDAARMASARDLIVGLQPHVGLTLVVGQRPGIDPLAEAADVLLETDSEQPFHFGRTLQQLIQEHQLSGLIYFGSGSGGLLTSDQLRTFAQFAGRPTPSALFNNFYSCDFGAFAQTHSLLRLDLPAVDNGLGFCLSDAGIDCYQLPRTLATQFDIDTPTDLLLAKSAEQGGEHLRRALEQVAFDHPALDTILSLLTDRTSMLYLIGRVNPATWRFFEQEVACRTSGMIEGRGMKATASTRARFLATTLREHGADQLFSILESCADGALIDTRPLLADANGTLPSQDVRYNSDMFRLDEVHNPRWHELTARAMASQIPIILGGHSLVSGGLYLLADACWKGRDLPRRLHPEPFEREELPYESD